MALSGDGTAQNSGQTALRLTRRAALLSALALPLAGCWGSTYEWNQKLTLVVQTPSDDRVASAVTEITKGTANPIGAGPGAYTYMKGEAVVLELVHGRYLFVLLEDNQQSLAIEFWRHANGAEETWALIQRTREKVELPPKLYPRFVTFDDIHDPKTLKLVDSDDMDAVLGSCASGKEFTNAETPWRASQVTYHVWALEKWHVEWDRKAGAATGLDKAIVADLIEYEALERKQNRSNKGEDKFTDLDKQRWSTFREQFFGESKIEGAWSVFRENQIKQRPPEYIRRDTSHDCYKIKSMTLEITDEPVTRGVVKKVIPWIDDPSVMKNAGWAQLPAAARELLGGFVIDF